MAVLTVFSGTITDAAVDKQTLIPMTSPRSMRTAPWTRRSIMAATI